LPEGEYRMAMGLGMTDAEWEDLKSQVDDSFWVLRIIGLLAVLLCTLSHLGRPGYPPLPDDDEGFSCGAHKYGLNISL
jgi:hypothetical protein